MITVAIEGEAALQQLIPNWRSLHDAELESLQFFMRGRYEAAARAQFRMSSGPEGSRVIASFALVMDDVHVHHLSRFSHQNVVYEANIYHVEDEIEGKLLRVELEPSVGCVLNLDCKTARIEDVRREA